jgi:hypothetical protein
MKRTPNQLEFISSISPDGETLILNPNDISPLESFDLLPLSLTNQTYIARGHFGTYIVKPKTLYYLKTSGYLGNSFYWWKIDCKGYTTDIREAHKFTMDELKQIVTREYDVAYECDYIDNLLEAQKLSIDHQHVDYKKEIRLVDK